MCVCVLLVKHVIFLMVGADMAPQSGLALADLVTGGIAASVLHLYVNRLHVILQVILFVKDFLTDNTGKLAEAGGQNLYFHVGVQKSCKKYEL